jgi:LacI family transcriptional regulator
MIHGLSPIDERYIGYRDALDDRGLPIYDPIRINSHDGYEFFETDVFEVSSDEQSELVNSLINKLTTLTPQPTAIFAVNDFLAIISLLAIQRMGKTVPEDFSIVGFDDISLAAYVNVPLTTISQDAHELGKVAAQQLIERLMGNTNPPVRTQIPTQLRVRRSTSTPVLQVDEQHC